MAESSQPATSEQVAKSSELRTWLREKYPRDVPKNIRVLLVGVGSFSAVPNDASGTYANPVLTARPEVLNDITVMYEFLTGVGGVVRPEEVRVLCAAPAPSDRNLELGHPDRYVLLSKDTLRREPWYSSAINAGKHVYRQDFRSAFLDAVQELSADQRAQKASGQSLLIVYFTGHGVRTAAGTTGLAFGDTAVVPSDGSIDETSLLGARELWELFANATNDEIQCIQILDSCYGDGAAVRMLPSAQIQRAVLSASVGVTRVVDDPQRDSHGHSVYTWVLANAKPGRDGPIPGTLSFGAIGLEARRILSSSEYRKYSPNTVPDPHWPAGMHPSIVARFDPLIVERYRRFVEAYERLVALRRARIIELRQWNSDHASAFAGSGADVRGVNAAWLDDAERLMDSLSADVRMSEERLFGARSIESGADSVVSVEAAVWDVYAEPLSMPPDAGFSQMMLLGREIYQDREPVREADKRRARQVIQEWKSLVDTASFESYTSFLRSAGDLLNRLEDSGIRRDLAEVMDSVSRELFTVKYNSLLASMAISPVEKQTSRISEASVAADHMTELLKHPPRPMHSTRDELVQYDEDLERRRTKAAEALRVIKEREEWVMVHERALELFGLVRLHGAPSAAEVQSSRDALSDLMRLREAYPDVPNNVGIREIDLASRRLEQLGEEMDRQRKSWADAMQLARLALSEPTPDRRSSASAAIRGCVEQFVRGKLRWVCVPQDDLNVLQALGFGDVVPGGMYCSDAEPPPEWHAVLQVVEYTSRATVSRRELSRLTVASLPLAELVIRTDSPDVDVWVRVHDRTGNRHDPSSAVLQWWVPVQSGTRQPCVVPLELDVGQLSGLRGPAVERTVSSSSRGPTRSGESGKNEYVVVLSIHEPGSRPSTVPVGEVSFEMTVEVLEN